MRHVAVLALCVALSACEKTPTDGAVRVVVKYGSYTPGCVRVSAEDGQGHRNSEDIPQSRFTRLEEKEVVIGVFRKPEWAQQLTVTVESYDASTDEQCSGTMLETHTSDSITVPAGKFTIHEVPLLASNDDGDNQISKKDGVAGTDCDDSNAEVYQGAVEQCCDSVDFDCDGQRGCADSDCQQGCGPSPTTGCREGPGVWDSSTRQCEYTLRPAQASCDDGNLCTQSDACDRDGQCVGAATKCTQSTNVCEQSAGRCDAATGQCVYPPKESTTQCDDNDSCTDRDQCDGAGDCAGMKLSDCIAPRCFKPAQKCPVNGVCSNIPDPEQKGDACTTANEQSGACRETGECKRFSFDPSNFDPEAIPQNQVFGTFVINCGSDTAPVTFNSDSLQWSPTVGCGNGIPIAVTQDLPNGRKAAVIPMREFTIEQGKMLRLVGTRPVILAVYGNATLRGELSANGLGKVPGAGGSHMDCGSQTGGTGAVANDAGSGGGGGAFGKAGANGGKNQAGTLGGNGGTPPQLKLLVPLVGGCAGGSGGGGDLGGVAGAGGGALQVAVSGTLEVAHWISVSGGGGGGGRDDTAKRGGGGGGGSGGGLLLEADRLEVTSDARLTANGGGGGEAGFLRGDDGAPGQDGSRDSGEPALGGASTDGKNGGSGGAEGDNAMTGENGDNPRAGGGGGGGVGVIRARGISGCTIDTTCDDTDNNGCDLSPKVRPECP